MTRTSRSIVVVVVVLSLLFCWTARARAADVVRGHIESIATEESEFMMTDLTGKQWRFKLADNAVIRQGDRATVEELMTPDGKLKLGTLVQMMLGAKQFTRRPVMELASLRQGDAVAVTYSAPDRQLVALEVCVSRNDRR
jgi:hypothetical protein